MQSWNGWLNATRIGTRFWRAPRVTASLTSRRTCSGVPPRNQIPVGVPAIALISVASRVAFCFSSPSICATAPGGASELRKRVFGGSGGGARRATVGAGERTVPGASLRRPRASAATRASATARPASITQPGFRAGGAGRRAGEAGAPPGLGVAGRGAGGQTVRRANGARSFATAAADGWRAPGASASARSIAAHSSAGTSGATDASGTAGWVAMWCRTAFCDSPGWGRRPDTSSYRIVPSACTSARSSKSCSPRACSGDMYAVVPTIVPVRVSAVD